MHQATDASGYGTTSGSVDRLTPISSERLDKIGAGASMLCAVHCAAMPLVVTILPLIGLGFLMSTTAEWVFLGGASLLAVFSLCLGYRRHGSRKALMMLAFGIGLVAWGHSLGGCHTCVATPAKSRPAILRNMPAKPCPSQPPWWAVALSVAGGLGIAASHLINIRLSRACTSCDDHREDFRTDGTSPTCSLA